MRKPYKPSYADVQTIEKGDIRRACGDCICEACKLEYWRHRQVQGYTWLTRICDGSFVKL